MTLEAAPTLRPTFHKAFNLGKQVQSMALPTPVTILVIEDEPSLVRGLALLLHRDSYRVATASNGRHALARLQEQP